MTIALIAHDSKKELMVQFCMAYRHILEQHRLLATGTTGRLVEENAGLKVTKFLPGGHGGAEQIVARIACEEVDMLLFFRDPISAKPSEPNEMNLLRICDVHNVPVATNIATVEVLIHGVRCRQVGRICMDMCMVDVTDVPDVREGDTATIFGTDGSESISVDELAEKAGTISYEMLCAVSPRVPRVYLG